MTNVSNVVRPVVHGQATQPILFQNYPIPNAYPAKMIHCDVVFGSPSMNCNGTGICKLTSSKLNRPTALKRDCRMTFGQISATQEGKISLYFFREYLCIHLYRQHFRKGLLDMKESCPLPSGIAKSLKIKGKKLVPGKYAVLECDGYFRVDLDYI